MKEELPKTKVTVKLRMAEGGGKWHLAVEAYPVYKPGVAKPCRVVEQVKRSVTTPIWDKTTRQRVRPDGSAAYKVKRDVNGIIQCRSRLDQESCIFADYVRQLRQHEYDSAALYTGREKEIAEQNEREKQDFIGYFLALVNKRHPHSSKSIIINWQRVHTLLLMYSHDKPIPFSSIGMSFIEDFRMFILNAPQGGGKQGIVSSSTASTYFSIAKAALKQAFVDGYLSIDYSAKAKNIAAKQKKRECLTMDEVRSLAETPCESDVLRRAALFSILTGMRHSDIKALRWHQVQREGDTWRVDFTQQKTREANYLPISDEAYSLCGERREPVCLVFEGLTDASWINRPLKKWVTAAGITKHITFHCFRHTFATLQLAEGTDIYTIKSMLGHTNVRTTQIYAHMVDSSKVKAANKLKIGEAGKKGKNEL